MSGFVHLHTHSEYSLLDGHASIPRLIDRAVNLGMPALALTDHGAMFGAVEFYKAARGKLKPIIGCEAYFTTDSRKVRDPKQSLYHLLLLAKNETGYRNLMAMISESHTGGFYYKPRVDLELLEEYHEGLICTSACMSGVVSKSIEHGQPDEARKWAETYSALFGEDFYLEVQGQGIVADNGLTQAQITTEIASLGRELGIGLVATNDIHYVMSEDAPAQDLLLCVGTASTIDDVGRMKFSSDQFYMKSADEMAAALPEYAEALANTLAIADACEIELEFDRIILPVFETPAGKGEAEFLREECLTGLKWRYGDPVPDEALERLDTELAVVTGAGLSAYFLIVADFVRWAKEHGIGVGPGRGSAAGSIISYALGITALDPIEHGLLFERFLNPERLEMPDIDIDFDDERRGEVIDYVRRRYGEDRVAQVVTYSTMKARAAIRDAGRVLGYPFGVPDKIAKMVPERIDRPTKEDELLTDLQLALRDAQDFRAAYHDDADAKRVIDAALSLENVVRGEGVHAAAVVICRTRAAQDGLPRPAHAHGHRQGDRGDLRASRRADRHRLAAHGRREDLGASSPSGHRRRLPGGVRRYETSAARLAANVFRRHRGRRRTVQARPDGRDPRLHRPQARAHGHHLLRRAASAHPRGDIRRYRLSGTGDAHHHGDGGLLGGESRQAAQGHGQEEHGHRGRARARVR
jgi:DNA polymerase-3 subunit alpha